MPTITIKTRYTISPVHLDTGRAQAAHAVATGATRATIVVETGYGGAPSPILPHVLLEDGFDLLLEDGSLMLLE